MMKKIYALITGLYCILFIAFPLTSNAEWMTGAYVGYSAGDDGNIVGKTDGARQYESNFDVDGSFVLGYRVGYWLESLPWLGFSADISYFRPDVDFEFISKDNENENEPITLRETGELGIVPISPLLMLRIPLGADQEFPKGRFQPYVALGPGVFLSWFDTDNFDDSGVEIGLDARAGIAAMVAYNIAVFAEYRYTGTEFTFDEHVDGIRNELEIDLDTHHFTIGIFYYF